VRGRVAHRIVSIIAIATVCCSTFASAQVPLFSNETYAEWSDDANGRGCETPLLGRFRAPADNYQAAFPPEALEARVRGDVLLTFDTEYRDGALAIVNPRVFASSPAGLYDEAARAVAQFFQFPATMRNCQGLRAALSFRVIEGSSSTEPSGYIIPSGAFPPLSEVASLALRDRNLRAYCGIESGPINPQDLGLALQDLYPSDALSREIEGYAVLTIDIEEDGSVQDARLLEEWPQGAGFGAAGQSAIMVARYPSRTAPCEDAAVRVRFSVGN
jgi:hypothetical protein